MRPDSLFLNPELQANPSLSLVKSEQSTVNRVTDAYGMNADEDSFKCLFDCGFSQTHDSGLLRPRNLRPLHSGAEQPQVEGKDSQLHQKGLFFLFSSAGLSFFFFFASTQLISNLMVHC